MPALVILQTCPSQCVTKVSASSPFSLQLCTILIMVNAEIINSSIVLDRIINNDRPSVNTVCTRISSVVESTRTASIKLIECAFVSNDSLQAGPQHCATWDREVECTPMYHVARRIAADTEMRQRLKRKFE